MYMVELYIDDFMNLVILVSQDQFRHVGNAVMHSTHDIFPPEIIDSNDPISEKKLGKGEGGQMRLKKLSWVLILMEMLKQCGSYRPSAKITNSSEKLDTYRKEGI